MQAELKAPSFFQHLVLLWRLRLTIGLNRGDGKHRWFSVVAFLFSASPSLALAVTFYGFMQHPVVTQSDAWGDFLVRLLLFVTSATWVTWPVLSAGVTTTPSSRGTRRFPSRAFA